MIVKLVYLDGITTGCYETQLQSGPDGQINKQRLSAVCPNINISPVSNSCPQKQFYNQLQNQ